MLLPNDLSDKYKYLAMDDIYAGIELAAIRVSKIMLGKTVQANVAEDCLHLYNLDSGQVKELNLKGLRRIIGKPLTEEIEMELMRRDAIAESHRFSKMRGGIVTGEIAGRKPNGEYSVHVLMSGSPPLEFYAVLPNSQQCDNDRRRGLYNIGTALSFYLYTTQVRANPNRVWVQHILSRTTKDFACVLLERISGVSAKDMICTERIPGERSTIITKTRIPKECINTVGKELRETLHVTYKR